ncbi:hypothetical protein [Ramlibacter sp. PS4R-6]|uniref:hypothetical protein n=1 Tax=Ramlibacter sp. PS4R-6 TaxID=3133438 RepID=UPI0030ABDBA1
MPVVLLVIVGWLYVALMMSLAEATHSNGSVIGGIFTFVLYGVAPVALVGYILLTPARKRALKAREKAELGQPDDGGETPADPVAPVRKEP